MTSKVMVSLTALLLTLAPLGLVGCEKQEGGPKTADNGLLDKVDGMDVLWLWGTREEMGYAEGALLCGRIRDMFRDYVLDYVVPNSGYDYDMLNGMVGVAYAIPADDERELRAMVLGMQENCPAADLIVESPNLDAAAGARRDVRYEDLVIAHALADWACSSLTVWGEASATGSTLHARNLDFLLDPAGVILDQPILKVYRSSEDGDAAWASVSFPGLIGCISCFNDEGTGITMHNVDGLDSENGAVPRMLAARAALVASVDAADPAVDAETALEGAPQQVGNNLHFSVACDGSDCLGGVVFEYDGLEAHADGRVTPRAPGDVDDGVDTADAVVCTNHYVARETAPTSGGSYDRYVALADGVNAALATGGLDRAGALALMKTTADLNLGSPTVHTVIMDSATMTLELFIPSDVGTDAPYAVPYTFDLNAIFAAFPE